MDGYLRFQERMTIDFCLPIPKKRPVSAKANSHTISISPPNTRCSRHRLPRIHGP